MAEEKNKIIVPCDFTEKADFAFEHAAKLSKSINAEIYLLHIIDEKNSEAKHKALKDEAKTKFEKIIADTKTKFNLVPNYLIRTGNIFQTINEVAEELNALMTIMGTHGMKGMQKITGSWALKVIEGSKVPFLVVQAPPSTEGYKDVVFPIDFNADKVEKVKWANFLSGLYKCKIHIIYKKYTDKLLHKKLQSNLNTSLNYLQNNKVEYVLKPTDDKGKFHDQVIDYAVEIKADVILITTTRNISTFDYMLGAPEQQIIANKENIPVMCVNPSKLSVTRAVF